MIALGPAGPANPRSPRTSCSPAFEEVAASTIAGDVHGWAAELWHAGTFLFLAGVLVSVLAPVAGLVDASTSSEAGTQARRIINTTPRSWWWSPCSPSEASPGG